MFDAFKTTDPLHSIPNLSTRVEKTSFDKRLQLLDTLESEFQRGRLLSLNEKRTQHQTATERATQMMSSSQLQAFDVKQESASKLESFGDSGFGRGCLAAIRLLQTGVRCVEVEISGWDTHINNHQLQSTQASTLDKALAATLTELADREMLDDTIVLCGGEFGRTPIINPAGGRDHWPHGFSMLVAGGNFRRGYVHGKTDPKPDEALIRGERGPIDPLQITENVVTIADLHATVLSALGINHREMQQTPIGRPLAWSDGKVLDELLA
jgi:uncharacterized protein (DUF1501 family)